MFTCQLLSNNIIAQTFKFVNILFLRINRADYSSDPKTSRQSREIATGLTFYDLCDTIRVYNKVVNGPFVSSDTQGIDVI